jgi:hypothetical protein
MLYLSQASFDLLVWQTIQLKFLSYLQVVSDISCSSYSAQLTSWSHSETASNYSEGFGLSCTAFMLFH